MLKHNRFLHGHRLEALFHLKLATGLRRGEIMALKWQDIDFAHGELRVQRILSRIPSQLPGKGYVEAEVKTPKSRSHMLPTMDGSAPGRLEHLLEE